MIRTHRCKTCNIENKPVIPDKTKYAMNEHDNSVKITSEKQNFFSKKSMLLNDIFFISNNAVCHYFLLYSFLPSFNQNGQPNKSVWLVYNTSNEMIIRVLLKIILTTLTEELLRRRIW